METLFSDNSCHVSYRHHKFYRPEEKMEVFAQALLVGLIGLPLPVMMIEGPINALVLSGFTHSSKWFTIVYGGLMAGLVEETTRYLVLRFSKRKEV